MTKRLVFFGLLCGGMVLQAQNKKIQLYNTFIENINLQVDYINKEQMKLQQYHQDLFRFFRVFDTLQISAYPIENKNFEEVEVPEIVTKTYQQFSQAKQSFDSIIHTINYEKDMEYSVEKIEAINLRLDKFDSLSADLHLQLSIMEKDLNLLDLESRKEAYLLMKEEMDKIEELILKLKRNKIEISEIEYYIPEKLRVKLPSTYLAILQLFETRLQECQSENSKETIIHYFLPEKYFDIWIMRKYSLKYWQVQYLEDVLVNPKHTQGLKTYYNTEVKKETLMRLKNVNSFNRLPFEYVPPIKSPLGYHQKIFFILILDISNSMNENNKLQILKNAVSEFVEVLRPEDKFSIILFSNTSKELVLPKDRDKEWIKYQIENIQAFGNTLPENAIFRAYNIMNLLTDEKFHNQIILITDGIFDVTGKMKYHVKEGKKKDIRFSIFNIEKPEEDISSIRNLAEMSDGQFYFIEGSQTYRTLIEELLRN